MSVKSADKRGEWLPNDLRKLFPAQLIFSSVVCAGRLRFQFRAPPRILNCLALKHFFPSDKIFSPTDHRCRKQNKPRATRVKEEVYPALLFAYLSEIKVVISPNLEGVEVLL
jgi:hypothetical protein